MTIYFLIFALALISFFGTNIRTTKAAETRPTDCTTASLKQCATASPSGYTLHLWRSNGDQTGNDESFVFVGATDFGLVTQGDIGEYAYRSTTDPNFYIAVRSNSELNIQVTHHYRVGSETSWNQFAVVNGGPNRDYKLLTGKLPTYKNAISSTTNQRFVWRIVANGKILLNDKPVSGAFIKLHFDQNGALLADKNNAEDGTFEFSYRGTNQDIWINEGTVKKLTFYVGLIKDGKNYEITKYVDIPSGWKNHSDGNTKLINLGDIKLVDSNEVNNLKERPGGEQSQAEEAASDGGSACEQKCKLTFLQQFSISANIQSALCSAQCFIIEMEAQIIAVVVEKVLYPALGI